MVELFTPDNSGLCGLLCLSQTVFNHGNNSIYWVPFAGAASVWICFLFAQLVQAVRICRNPQQRLLRVLVLVLSALLLLGMFGLDLAIWSFLAVLSIAVLAGERLEGRNRFEIGLAALLAAASFAVAGVFSIPALVLASLILLFSDKRHGAALVGVALCLVIVLGVVAPGPELPSYPSGAEVVPSYNTVDGLTPFIGDQLPIRSVNLALVRERLAGSLPIVAALLLISALLLGQLPRVPTLLLLFVFLDSSLLKPFYAQMMPVQSLSRVLPGGLFYPLSYLMLAGIVAAIGMELQNLRSWVQSRGLVLCGLLAGCIVIVLLGRGLYLSESDLKLSREIRAADPGDPVWTKLMLNSPSYFVISATGMTEVQKRIVRRDAIFIPVGNLIQSVVSAGGPIDTELIADGKSATGWHTDQPVQRGGEWLEISMKEPVSGIRLDTGVYFSDFPRGLRVRYLDSCPGDRGEWQYAPVAADFSPNYGDVAVTDEGYPYFNQQYSLSALLPKGQVGRCFLIEQTGEDSHYAWTVADVLIVPAVPDKERR